VRPDFKADLIIDTDSRQVKRTNVVHTQIRRIFGEIPIVSFSIAAVIACFIGNIIYDRSNTEPSNSVAASIINAVVIIVLDAIYRKLATMMANWENHRYSEDYESSLITKNFAFTFVNSNIALFSIAFYEQNFNKLTQNLAIILAVKQIALSGLEIILPWLKFNLKKWRLDRIFNG
jgi:Calcium-activated chloride channel